jgi:hypothetical protein
VTLPVRSSYRASPTPLPEEKPLAAPVLVAIGGFLVVLEGLLIVESSTFDMWVVLLAGLLLMGWALIVRHEPHHHVANGITILFFVLLTFVYGYGGFYLGGILAGVGGLLAIVWKPRPLTGPVRVQQ